MRAVIALLLLALAACGQVARQEDRALPALQLTPASLGRSLTLTQRLTVQALPGGSAVAAGAPVNSVEVQLEIDAEGLRLAAFALNQRVLTLRWDGKVLAVQRHPLLPEVVDAVRIVRDIQFAYWPAGAIQAALPADWHCDDGPGMRIIRHGDQAELIVHYLSSERIELDNLREHYRLVIESRESTAS